jgi:hypothetical protein
MQCWDVIRYSLDSKLRILVKYRKIWVNQSETFVNNIFAVNENRKEFGHVVTQNGFQISAFKNNIRQPGWMQHWGVVRHIPYSLVLAPSFIKSRLIPSNFGPSLFEVSMETHWRTGGGWAWIFRCKSPSSIIKYGLSSQHIFASVFWVIDVDIIVG